MSTRKDNTKSIHKYFMKLAFNQASKVLGNTGQNPAVGCVIVKGNNVISLGHTNYSGRPHAEYNALSNKKLSYDDSILYSTLEPCSHYGKTQPCTNIIKRKIGQNFKFNLFPVNCNKMSVVSERNKLYKKKKNGSKVNKDINW